MAQNPWEMDWNAPPEQTGPVAIPLPPSAQDQARDQRDAARLQMDNNRLQLQIQEAMRNAQRDTARLQMDLRSQGLMVAPDGSVVPDPQGKPRTAEQNAETRDRLSRLNQLIAQINRTEELYRAGPGSTKRLGGLIDYLPTDANAAFDTAGAQLSQIGLAAFRVPGTGTVSDRDAIMFDRANLPTASTRDAAIEEQLRGIRSRVEEELRALGQPAPRWTGDPSQKDDKPVAVTPWNMDRTGGAGGGAAPLGSDRGGVPVPPEYQTEYEAYVTANRGRLNPDDYARFRMDLDAKYGFARADSQYPVYAQEAQRMNEDAAAGRSLNLNVPPAERDLSATEQLRNNLVNNPVGAFVAGAANMGGFGVPEALASQQYDALRENRPVATTLGEIGGAIAGTEGLAAATRGLTQRLAPRLLGGGKGAALARGVGTDAAYGGLYGTTTEGDPLPGAAAATLGSLGGRAVGSAVGRALTGARIAPEARFLRAQGVPLTVGQSLGGTAKRIEDAMTSFPLVGDQVVARRLEGLEGFNAAAMREAGQPIGATVNEIGERGLNSLRGQISDAYDRATAGVTVPLDATAIGDLANVRQSIGNLPPDLATRAAQALKNRVDPVESAGQMTGETYQQAARGLKGYRAEATKPGFEQDYRDILTAAQDALTGTMQRGGGANVVSGLSNADKSYRLAKTLSRAMEAAKNGAGSGEAEIFTPAQLNSAAYATAKKFPGARPFKSLALAGQKVLPSKVPDSGTATRLATMAMPAAIGGSAAGFGALLGGQEGAATGAGTSLAATAILALGGTKAGQKLITEAISGRPAAVKALGAKIRKKGGLFGSASVPLALEANK